MISKKLMNFAEMAVKLEVTTTERQQDAPTVGRARAQRADFH